MEEQGKERKPTTATVNSTAPAQSHVTFQSCIRLRFTHLVLFVVFLNHGNPCQFFVYVYVSINRLSVLSFEHSTLATSCSSINDGSSDLPAIRFRKQFCEWLNLVLTSILFPYSHI